MLRLQTASLGFIGIGKRSPQPPPTPVQPPPTIPPQIQIDPPADERTASPELTPAATEYNDRPEIAVDVSCCYFPDSGLSAKQQTN